MYYKFVQNGYIIGVGVGAGGEEISETEYNKLLDIIANRPEAPEGYYYALKDICEWKLQKLPPSEQNEEVEEEIMLNEV